LTAITKKKEKKRKKPWEVAF